MALRELGLGFRAKYLARAAIRVAEGELDLEEVRGLPYWEARERLTDLYGIGAKIADCVLVFSLDKLEAFPIDRWVSRAVQEWYLNRSEDEVRRHCPLGARLFRTVCGLRAAVPVPRGAVGQGGAGGCASVQDQGIDEGSYG